MTGQRTQRPLRADAARNRQALIDAAQRLFALRGLSVTLDDIAAEAGVNVATAYRNFASKHELAVAFLRQKIEQAFAITQEAASAEDPWEGIRVFLTRMLELLVANRGLHEVLTPGYKERWLEHLTESIEPLLADLVERAQDAGRVRRELEPTDLGVALQMLAAVSDIPTDDQRGLLARYLTLMLAALHPSTERLPGRAPTMAQTREAFANPNPSRSGQIRTASHCTGARSRREERT